MDCFRQGIDTYIRILGSIAFLGAWAFTGCTSGPHIGDNPDILTVYHRQTSPNPAIDFQNEVKTDIYLDYSASMYSGVISSYDLLDRILTITDLPSTEAFRIGDGEMEQIMVKEISTEQSSKHYARDIKSYSEQNSYLRAALQSIKTRKNAAVFITDFVLQEGSSSSTRVGCNGTDLVTVKFNDSNWATKDFTDLLQSGYAIDIYSKTYKSRSNSKLVNWKIFYLCFTPQTTIHDGNPGSVANRLRSNPPKGFSQLQFSNLDYTAFEDYTGKPEYQRGLGSQIEKSSFFENKEAFFSFYQVSRNDVIFALGEEEISPEQEILDNLFFHNNMSCFPKPEFSLEVHDITDDIAGFLTHNIMFEKEVEDQPVRSRYEHLPTTTVSDLFALSSSDSKEKTLFKVRIPKPELLPFDSRVYRLDIILKSAKLVLPEKSMEEQLTWSYNPEDCIEMTALKGSLAEAMHRAPVKERRLFTYYLEILN